MNSLFRIANRKPCLFLVNTKDVQIQGINKVCFAVPLLDLCLNSMGKDQKITEKNGCTKSISRTCFNDALPFFGSQSEAQENDQCLPFMLRGSELTELIQGNHRQEFVNILSQFSNDVRAPEVLQGILDDLTDKDLANGEFFEEGGLMIPCEIQKDGDWHVQLHTRDTNPKTASVIDIPVSPKKIVDLYAILDTVSK